MSLHFPEIWINCLIDHFDTIGYFDTIPRWPLVLSLILPLSMPDLNITENKEILKRNLENLEKKSCLLTIMSLEPRAETHTEKTQSMLSEQTRKSISKPFGSSLLIFSPEIDLSTSDQ